jgi:hypothetical protein
VVSATLDLIVDPVQLPHALHGQLYLLAYDRAHRRFGGAGVNTRWLLHYALRAAILTDLYLAGSVEDRNGRVRCTATVHPDDPVLLEAQNDSGGWDWASWIARGRERTQQAVNDQLQESGWIQRRKCRKLGVIPAVRFEPFDQDMVDTLGRRMIEVLRNAIDDKPAEPRLLAIGLIAVQAQMPVASSFIDNPQQRAQLREMTFAAIEPILGLHQAIQNRFADIRSQLSSWGG